MHSFLLLLIISGLSSLGYGNLVNVQVSRNINIASQLVKVSTTLLLENAGKSPVSSFNYLLEPDTASHLSYFGASLAQDDKGTVLKADEVPVRSNNQDIIKVHLKTPLAAGKSVSVRIESVFSHSLTPHPSTVTQSEKQLVLYHGNHYYYTPYHTKSQTTMVTLPGSSVESYSKLKPVSHTDKVITYGPYENISPNTLNKMIIHFENNSPFISVTNLNRAIEVSHWGIISIEEDIDVAHRGAALKGAFSRYEFQRDQSSSAAVKSFKTVLPASASDVYYRDEIGNISTSNLRMLDDSTEVELRPRFPLFGGWKTHYVLGYYVPTYEYLYNTDNKYVLKMRFVDHVFDDSVIDLATVKVILPEGSKNIQVKMPYSIKRLANEQHYTYLDTVGRPVIVLQKTNLVEQHILDFEVHYQYQKGLMLQEPLLVVAALYLLFIAVIIYVRLDFSITRDPTKESKLRVTGIIENIHNHCDNRTSIYAKFEEALGKYKHSKDLSSYQSLMKKLNTDHKNETQAIADLLLKLKQEGSDATEKVVDLQRYDKAFKEQLQQQSAIVERLVANKISKQQYLESDGAIVKKKEEIVEKINNVLCSM